LHSAQVSKSSGHTVQRWSRKEKKRVSVVAPPVTREYSDCMGAVDMNDGDGANYSVSFRSNRWYLRLFCWSLERVIHANFQLTVFFANGNAEEDDDGDDDDTDEDDEDDNGSGKEEWKCYTNKEDGRYKFQIDLAMQLIEYGIRLDWQGDANDPDNSAGKPAWVRQAGLIPCDCKRCFFCKTGRTTGITDKPLKRTAENALPRGHSRDRETVSTNARVCQLCYAELGEKHKNMSSAEKKKKSRRSSLGCLKCDKCVCAYCWDSFVHVNNNVN
jgi:hypothetical protein